MLQIPENRVLPQSVIQTRTSEWLKIKSDISITSNPTFLSGNTPTKWATDLPQIYPYTRYAHSGEDASKGQIP
jgi:hypothetical protein